MISLFLPIIHLFDGTAKREKEIGVRESGIIKWKGNEELNDGLIQKYFGRKRERSDIQFNYVVVHFSLARFRETRRVIQLLVAPYKIYQQTRTHRVWQLSNTTTNNKNKTHLSRDSFYARRIAFRPKKTHFFFVFISFISLYLYRSHSLRE